MDQATLAAVAADVSLDQPQDGQVLGWDAAQALWVPVTPAAGGTTTPATGRATCRAVP